MAAVPLKPRKSEKRRRRRDRSKVVKRLTGKFILLAALMGIIIAILYIPWRFRFDEVYAKTTLVTESAVEGVDSLTLISAKDLKSRSSELGVSVIFIDLKDHWSLLPEILPLQRPIILTGISPYTAAQLAEMLDSHSAYTGYMEFDERGEYVKEVLKLRREKTLVFRVHNLKKKEYPNYDVKAAVVRYVRAVRERSIDMLLFLKPENDFAYEDFVRQVDEKLEELNLLQSSVTSPRAGNSRFFILSTAFILFLVASLSPFLALVILPLWIFFPSIGLPLGAISGHFAIYYYLSKTARDTVRGILLFFAFSVFLGLSINSSMLTPAYQNGLELFRGVKLSLVTLPGWLFLRGFLRSAKQKMSGADVAILCLVTIGAVYYILRSGNFSLVLDLERQIRDILDSLLLVRPRFKEILAYPLLVISIKNGFKFEGKLGPLIIAGGSISIVSVVNTFCHATVPLWTGLLRSLYSLVFGVLFALVLKWFSNKNGNIIKESEGSLNVES